MRVYQFEYDFFYDDVCKKLSELIREREGRHVAFLGRRERGTVNRQMHAPMNMGSQSGTNRTASAFRPQEEAISLSECRYGDFIDERYKERFISACKQNGCYDRLAMSGLAKVVATAIYDRFRAPARNIDSLLEKIRKTGYDSLTRDEKQMVFEAGSVKR